MYKIQCQHYHPEHTSEEAFDYEPPWFDDPVIETERAEGNLFNSLREATEYMMFYPTWFLPKPSDSPHRHFYSFRIVKIP